MADSLGPFPAELLRRQSSANDECAAGTFPFSVVALRQVIRTRDHARVVLVRASGCRPTSAPVLAIAAKLALEISKAYCHSASALFGMAETGSAGSLRFRSF